MTRRTTRSVTCLMLSMSLIGAAGIAAAVHGVGPASAAPCSGSATGSSGLDLGSVGGSSGSSGPSGPAAGPQGPLPAFADSRTRTVSWVTGPRSPNDTLKRFGISGTDLGISWDNGHGQTLMAFGDTFGNCSVSGQQWRHNVLLRSDDTDLSNGIKVPTAIPGDSASGSPVNADSPRFSRQLISALGISDIEVTTIPTAAISIPTATGTRQYINYMSVRSWGSPGHWVTNFSAIAYSDDNGQNWTTDLGTILINTPISVPVALPAGIPPAEVNNGKFQQNAYVRGHGERSDYVYQFGTPNGRFGAGFLARVPASDILALNRYEYWAGSARGWVSNISQIPDDGSAIVVPAPVTELSVAWSPYLNKYIMIDGDNGVRLRTADAPEGPWSAPISIVPRGAIVLYGPMIHPQSPAIKGTGKDLYFNASRWSDYNVMLLRTDLSRVG